MVKLPTKRNFLHSIEIEEVSAVDRPANLEEFFLIKSKEGSAMVDELGEVISDEDRTYLLKSLEEDESAIKSTSELVKLLEEVKKGYTSASITWYTDNLEKEDKEAVDRLLSCFGEMTKDAGEKVEARRGRDYRSNKASNILLNGLRKITRQYNSENQDQKAIEAAIESVGGDFIKSVSEIRASLDDASIKKAKMGDAVLSLMQEAVKERETIRTDSD